MAKSAKLKSNNKTMDVITAFKDIPYFILSKELDPGEMSSVTKEFKEIKGFYDIYKKGAKFVTEGSCGDYIPSQIKYKIIRTLIDKQSRFMFGETPDFVVKGLGDEIEDESVKRQLELRQKVIDKVMDGNYGCNISKLLLQASKDCFIAKRVACLVDMNVIEGIKVHFYRSTQFIYETDYDDPERLIKFVAYVSVKDSAKSDEKRILVKRYELDVLNNPESTIVGSLNGDNGSSTKATANANDNVGSYSKSDKVVEGNRTNRKRNTNADKKYVKYICFVEEILYDGRGNKISEITPRMETKFDYIPAIIITNGGLLGNTHGESEIEQLKEMESGYSKMANADMDAERKGMNPIRYTVDMSVESTENLSSSAGSYWDLQHNQEMDEPKPMVGTLAPAMNHTQALKTTLGRIKNEMYSQVDVPNIDLETMEGVITSGKALKAIYWPLTIRCDEKLKTWIPALKFIMKVIIDGAMLYPNVSVGRYIEEKLKPTECEYSVEVNYPLPEDEQEEKEMNIQEVEAKTMSRKAYMKRWRLLSDSEADEELEQIAYETNLIENGGNMANSGQSVGSGNGDREGRSFWQEGYEYEGFERTQNYDQQQYSSFGGRNQ